MRQVGRITLVSEQESNVEDVLSPGSAPRLTRRQLAMVQDLAHGYDIAMVAERRGRGLSATYELADRICDRLGLSEWQEIGPYAVDRGLVDSRSADRPIA